MRWPPLKTSYPAGLTALVVPTSDAVRVFNDYVYPIVNVYYQSRRFRLDRTVTGVARPNTAASYWDELQTIAAHVVHQIDLAIGAVALPIYLS